ncbi:MAG: FAD:protein FMN transferase [Nitrospira sp.]|nr:FAD:protein FMN transferase [Nitrospira sp.]MBH0181099.1 FAD:protein FMN transferase [Nitrospira sp.]MBH0186269.1 FAD:protein FMN transferase [Nitrospira sp.]
MGERSCRTGMCETVIMAGKVLQAGTLFLLLITVMTGCAGMTPHSRDVVVKRAQMHMGTLVTITAVAADLEAGHKAIQAGFNDIKRLEQLLSTWIPESELSRVNAEAGRRPVPVSRETLDLVARSMEMARLTEGGFNIAVGPAVDAWSVTERQHIPSDEELQRLKILIDVAAIQIDMTRQTIYLPHKGMKIDVGGIGKGYAADQAAEEMKKAGAQGGVVALSGDIKTFGVLPDAAGFPVGIKHPRKEGAVIAVIDLQDEAISTAGDYERYFERDGVRYHHILDPQTLQPARSCQSVTVIGKEGVLVDGLDTGIFVLGPERGMALIERLAGVEAVIIDDQGTMILSSGLRSRLRAP